MGFSKSSNFLCIAANIVYVSTYIQFNHVVTSINKATKTATDAEIRPFGMACCLAAQAVR
jgi:hypothetical protein